MNLSVGISATDALAIAEAVGRANLMEMQGVASRLVDERLEHFNQRLIERTSAEVPSALDAVQDPDVQYALLTAQREYARSGAERLGETLIDLLVARSSAETQSLKAIVLNEAIATVARLTGPQVDALTVHWLCTRVRNTSFTTFEEFVAWLEQNLVPFVANLPSHGASYEHLAYTGCAAVQVTSIDLGGAFAATYPGLFARGLSEAGVPEPFQGTPVMTTCLHDVTLLQVSALNEEDARTAARSSGLAAHEQELVNLLQGNVLPSDAVTRLLSERVPQLAVLFTTWKSTQLNNLSLTSVGVAIAHSNWTRVAGGGPDLSVWIPDAS